MEVCATICNLSSNVTLFRRVCHNPTGPVPAIVVSLQVAGNACWMLHAWWIRDPYLATTAGTSAALQVFSLNMIVRHARRAPRESPSETKLPCLPPPSNSS